jgi:hypothetical protein
MLLSHLDGQLEDLVDLLENTMLLQTLKLDLIKEVPSNQPIMETTLSQHLMHGAMDQNSLTLTKVSANGGKFQ